MTFDFKAFYDAETRAHLDVAQNTFAALHTDLNHIVDACVHSIQNGGKIMLFGNGGSAADAQHLATEFSIRYASDREPIAAIALTTDTSALTAGGNDMGFDQIFARQVAALGKKGDIAIGISTSGNSGNVLNALKKASNMQIKTVGMTGQSGGAMDGLCDHILKVHSPVTARIQEMHITLGHILCGSVEQALGLV